MSCALCSTPVLSSGNVRPNVATFKCGHTFHLSCVLSTTVNKCQTECPVCNTSKSNLPNFGNDRIIAMESLITARREARLENKSGIFSWFSSSNLKSLITSGTSLVNLKLQGYLPEDFIEKQITWKKLTSVYKVSSLLDFGFRWDHMLRMGFVPENFKDLDWAEMFTTLQIRSGEILQTSITFDQLADLDIPIHRLRELGITWRDIISIGGNVKSLRSMTDKVSDLTTYFGATQPDLTEAGFTRENIERYKWTSNTIAPIRKKRFPENTLGNKTNKLYF